MRICITGGPRTGKTTLAASLGAGVPVTNCDDFISMGWSESSAHASVLMVRPGPWIMEGVQIPRALRKFIEAHPGTRPCDRLIILRNEPFVSLTAGQVAMAKGIDTVLAEILPALQRLGVEIEERR